MRNYNRYKKQHTEKVKCDTCNKFYVRCNKCKHVKTQFHKLVSYCKKIMLENGIHGAIDSKKHIEAPIK